MENCLLNFESNGFKNICLFYQILMINPTKEARKDEMLPFTGS